MPTYIAGTCWPIAYNRRVDATIPSRARIAACAEAACELELPTSSEVEPKERMKKAPIIYILCTLLLLMLLMLFIRIRMPDLPTK